jgi:CRISPR-associated DxTHG motif protein
MIISILGMAGEHKGKKTTAYYDCDILGKESGNYHNATDLLLKNYNDNFYFLGTKKAIEFQTKLLDLNKNSSVKCIEIEDNSLDDIFEEVFSLISKAKDNEKVLLDITHGFRHQPISAIFSATLHKFLNNSQLEVIFAKQIVEYKEYEYIYLTEYIEMTQLSLLLTGFIRTLNFVNSINIENLNTLAFEKFSRALLSNDFKALEASYKNLEITLEQAKKNKKFDHLKELFEQIEDTLKEFKDFSNKKIFEKYMILANLMYEKNYYLLSLTYLFEAIRLYASYSFYKNRIINNYAWENFDMYRLNRDVMSFITQKEFGDDYKQNFYDKTFPTLYEKNQTKFEKLAREYQKLRKLRNHLTHINHKESQSNIKMDLRNLLKDIGILIKEDILKNLEK